MLNQTKSNQLIQAENLTESLDALQNTFVSIIKKNLYFNELNSNFNNDFNFVEFL